MAIISILVLILGITLCSAGVVRRHEPAPFYDVANQEHRICNEFLVTLEPHYSLDTHFTFLGLNLSESSSDFKHLASINAYTVTIEAPVIHDLVRYDPGVLFVQMNSRMMSNTSNMTHPGDLQSASIDSRIQQDGPQSGILRRRAEPFEIGTDPKMYYGRRMINAWGKIDKVVEDGEPGDYLKGAGTGVNIYIVDSGVRITHNWFNGKASHFRGLSTSPYLAPGTTMDDLDGHGTGVASVAKYIAEAANIINVKVFGPGQSLLSFVQAINDIIEDHIKNAAEKADFHGSVINLSFFAQSVYDRAFENILRAASTAGIPVITAAGNENMEILTGPCTYLASLCVGSVDKFYARSDTSNYGPYVRYYAPGSLITIADHIDDTSTKLDSGTSFSTPHVSGVVAHFVDYESIKANGVDTIRKRLQSNEQWGLITGIPDGSGSVNILVNSGIHNPDKPVDKPYDDKEFQETSAGAAREGGGSS